MQCWVAQEAFNISGETDNCTTEVTAVRVTWRADLAAHIHGVAINGIQLLPHHILQTRSIS